MAKVTSGDKTIEVKDGELIMDACEQLGVPFSCREGICGICRIEVAEGMDNLNPKTQQEDDMDLEGNTRLACQCKIQKGEIKIKF